MELTLSVRSFQVPATLGTRAWPPRRPSVPTSRATRVTSSANADSVSTIVLMTPASAATSPFASTVIFCDRSPRATAVATWAIDLTCPVRLDAMTLTLSVRSFQVPETPRTVAWPPRLPSVPTSRATRVTSSANADSWSTIVLMVSFSSRISPRASTRIFCVRSPWATAVVTSAIERTWAVRLSAMTLTDSVRSFQVPETPLTSACPPSRPSVPTSRATRVTSPANPESWSTIVLMVSFSSRISPRAVTVIFCERSPLATAVATWAMERTWAVRFPAMKLTESVRSNQAPPTPGTSACPPRVPSVPTSRATRVTSEVNSDSWFTIPLKTVAISPSSPSAPSGSRVRKSPSRTAVSPASNWRSSDSPIPPSPGNAGAPPSGSAPARSAIRHPHSRNQPRRHAHRTAPWNQDMPERPVPRDPSRPRHRFR